MQARTNPGASVSGEGGDGVTDSIREWKEANGIRVFAVVDGEFAGLTLYTAEHRDGRTRNEIVGDDDHVTESYILDRLARAFMNDEVNV
jgi:hypothetical protein